MNKTGSDIVITNMTVLPEGEQGKGFGSRTVGNILQFARFNGLKEVRATQIEEHNEGFWTKNGFSKDEQHSRTNDFILKISEDKN